MRGIRNFFQAIGGGGSVILFFRGRGPRPTSLEFYYGSLKFINLNFPGWGPACMMVSFQLIGIENIQDS